jgi:hypothetical protein
VSRQSAAKSRKLRPSLLGLPIGREPPGRPVAAESVGQAPSRLSACRRARFGARGRSSCQVGLRGNHGGVIVKSLVDRIRERCHRLGQRNARHGYLRRGMILPVSRSANASKSAPAPALFRSRSKHREERRNRCPRRAPSHRTDGRQEHARHRERQSGRIGYGRGLMPWRPFLASFTRHVATVRTNGSWGGATSHANTFSDRTASGQAGWHGFGAWLDCP